MAHPNISRVIHRYESLLRLFSVRRRLTAAVGMCLLDTIDGALMMALYTSTAFAKDQIAILYYSIVLTVITVMVAMVIGLIQTLTLVRFLGSIELLSCNVPLGVRYTWEGVLILQFISWLMVLFRPSMLTESLI